MNPSQPGWTRKQNEVGVSCTHCKTVDTSLGGNDICQSQSLFTYTHYLLCSFKYLEACVHLYGQCVWIFIMPWSSVNNSCNTLHSLASLRFWGCLFEQILAMRTDDPCLYKKPMPLVEIVSENALLV